MNRSATLEKLFSTRRVLHDTYRAHWANHKPSSSASLSTYEVIDYALHRYIRKLRGLDVWLRTHRADAGRWLASRNP